MRDIRRFAYDEDVNEGRIIHLDTLVAVRKYDEDEWEAIKIPNNEIEQKDVFKLIEKVDIYDYSKRDVLYDMYDECKCCEEDYTIFTVDIVFEVDKDKKLFPREFAKDTYTKVKNMFYIIFNRDYIYDYDELTDFAVNVRDIFDFVYVDNRDEIIDFIQEVINKVGNRFKKCKHRLI